MPFYLFSVDPKYTTRPIANKIESDDLSKPFIKTKTGKSAEAIEYTMNAIK